MFYPSKEIYKIGLREKKIPIKKKYNNRFLFFPFMLISFSPSLSVGVFFFFFFLPFANKPYTVLYVCGGKRAVALCEQQRELHINRKRWKLTCHCLPQWTKIHVKTGFCFLKELLVNITILHSLMASMSMAVVTSSHTLLARQLLW